jgi:hypothetical protein
MPINLRELSPRLTLAAMHRIFDDFAGERVSVEKSLEKISDLGLEPIASEAGTEWDKFFRTLKILADAISEPQDRQHSALEEFAYVSGEEAVDIRTLC